MEKPAPSVTPETPREQYLERVRTLVQNHASLGIAADYDHNISKQGPSHGRDPRDSTVNPDIHQAFSDMIQAGTDVVIVSSRGARDIARIVNIPGISIVGSLGWETLDRNGESHIHPRFKPFEPQITGILQEVRERFFAEQLGRSPDIVDEPNTELATPSGDTIILQRKGYNSEYPEGINATWSLSLLPEEKRATYKTALERYYVEAFNKFTADWNKSDKATLREMCNFMLQQGKTADGIPTLDVEIRPASQGAKAKAIVQLMREPDDPKRQEHFMAMPSHAYWIYSGDHDVQDSAPMRAGRTAHKLSQGKRDVIGIWSKPSHQEEKEVRGVDVIVNSVAGNAALMKETAAIIAAAA